jgi:hypothetical protein
MATVVQPVGAHSRNRSARGTVARVAGLAITHDADEAALAQRAAAGDGDAFATLYERYESRVLNLCFRILGSQDDATDAAQEAFVNVLRRLPKRRPKPLPQPVRRAAATPRALRSPAVPNLRARRLPARRLRARRLRAFPSTGRGRRSGHGRFRGSPCGARSPGTAAARSPAPRCCPRRARRCRSRDRRCGRRRSSRAGR